MTDYYVDGDVGNDSNAGTSEGAGNAWATINKACQTMVAGDRTFVKAKASGSYSETATFAANGTSRLASGMIQLIGYTTTPGDEGRVHHSAATGYVLTSAVSGNAYYRVHNFVYTGGTQPHIWLANSNGCEIYNCHSFNSAQEGFYFGSGTLVVECLASSSAEAPIRVGGSCWLVGCTFHSGDTLDPWCVASSNASFYRCLFADMDYGAGSTVNICAQTENIIACTIDGKGDSGIGRDTDRVTLAVNVGDAVFDNVVASVTDGLLCVHTATAGGHFGVWNTVWADSLSSSGGFYWRQDTGVEADILGCGKLTYQADDTDLWTTRYSDYTPVSGGPLDGTAITPPAIYTFP